MTDRPESPTDLDSQLVDRVLACTGATTIKCHEPVQSLWSGFGQIIRLTLDYGYPTPAASVESLIVKVIQPPSVNTHPRGWNTDVSMQRKLRSYQVEANWYRQYAAAAKKQCAMPHLYAGYSNADQTTLIMEDLDRQYPVRHQTLSVENCKPCLRWLARFHAHHLGFKGDDLWPIGTYWHLATRLDEFNVMQDGELKQAANALDDKLNASLYQTLVHGDAKVANMCFSVDSDEVAMVDFQYVGRGCGIRDVAYFLGSCLDNNQCEQHTDELLDVYFSELIENVAESISSELEATWRALYATAVADFNRFLSGWMPEHHKINRYMRTMTRKALAEL